MNTVESYLFDDRRSRKLVSPGERIALVDRRRPLGPFDEDVPSRYRLGLPRRSGQLRRGDSRELRLLRDSDRGRAEIDDLEMRGLVDMTIDRGIGHVEFLSDFGDGIRAAEIRAGEIDGDLEGLAEIAHVGAPQHVSLNDIDVLVFQPSERPLVELGISARHPRQDFVGITLVQHAMEGGDEVALDVGNQGAEGTQRAGRIGNDDLGNADLFR